MSYTTITTRQIVCVIKYHLNELLTVLFKDQIPQAHHMTTCSKLLSLYKLNKSESNNMSMEIL